MNGLRIKIRKHKGLESIIVLLCSLLPFVDTINGFFEGNMPIGSVYKIWILGVLFFIIISKKSAMNKRIVTTSFAAVLYICFSVIINTTLFSGMLLSNDYPIKLIFNILLIGFFYQCIKNKSLSGYTFYRILDNSAWVFIFCFLIPYFLGIGSRIYADDIGYKAFFISQNEMSLVLIVLCFFVAYKLYLKVNLLNSVQLGFLVICCFLCNTKSTIISCLAIVIILLIIKVKNESFKSKISAFGIIIIGFFMLKNTMLSSLEAMMHRYTMLKSIHYNDSILTSVLSGRDYYLQTEWNNLMTEHSVFRFLFGNGFCSHHLIEMDLFDVFFSLGIIGVIFFCCFMVYMFKRVKTNTRSDRSMFRLLSFMIVVGFMFITGHVTFMAMSGSYFVIYCCFLTTYRAIDGK